MHDDFRSDPDLLAYPDDNPKTVLGVAKPSLSAVPPVALFVLGQAMANGAKKYGPFNWREKRVTASVYRDALLRHDGAWWDGEDVAPDSLIHHLGHVMACCAIVIDALHQGTLNDDRPKVRGTTAKFIADNTRKMEG